VDIRESICAVVLLTFLSSSSFRVPLPVIFSTSVANSCDEEVTGNEHKSLAQRLCGPFGLQEISHPSTAMCIALEINTSQ
jgi:hypothetical protein